MYKRQDLDYVAKYADKVLLLDKKILKQGTPKEVYASEEFGRIFGMEVLTIFTIFWLTFDVIGAALSDWLEIGISSVTPPRGFRGARPDAAPAVAGG